LRLRAIDARGSTDLRHPVIAVPSLDYGAAPRLQRGPQWRLPAPFLRSQSVILRSRHGTHRKYRPFAFTEQGVAMLSSVLRSPRAIAVNIEIMRAFVQLRRMLDSNADLARKLAELEQKYDGQFTAVFDAIRQLMAPPASTGRTIGFRKSDRKT
jgi:hypothetical protein